MKIYAAGLSLSKAQDDLLFSLGITNRLLSYLERNEKNVFNRLARNKKVSFFLDSGAFSASTLGKVIDIYEYIDYLQENHHMFDIYASLDVIGDWKKSAQNDYIMRCHGLNPIPAFHYGSPNSELIRMYREFDYIALGGLVPYTKRRKLLQSWLDHCFSLIKNEPIKKIHGYGLTSIWTFDRYPFYSVDSTSALKYAAYGRIVNFNKKKLNIDYYQYFRVKNENLHLYDFKNTRSGFRRLLHNLEQYKLMEDFYTSVWEKRGIKW